MQQIEVSKKRTLNPLSHDEKIAWCKRWKASKLPLVEFCKMHHILKSSLYGWYKRFFASDNEKVKPAFIPLSPSAKVLSEQEKVLIELTLANGAIIKFNMSLTMVVNLIQELGHAATVVR
jgi:hypothetical protein